MDIFDKEKYGEGFSVDNKNDKNVPDGQIPRWQALSIAAGMIILPCLFIWFVFISPMIEVNTNPKYQDDPTYYDTGNMEDMTKKEYQDFLDWKEKQSDNEKMFD